METGEPDPRETIDSTVDVICQDIDEPSWMDRARTFALKALAEMGYRGWELSLVFCGDEYIRTLNRDYRGKDAATDVLSFPQIDDPSEVPDAGPFFAGDIVISLETLEENARYFEVSEEEELKRLIIHGILHLGGWDHSDNSPEQEMLKLQERVLANLAKEKIY
jgi:probable rRNA maturation factor